MIDKGYSVFLTEHFIEKEKVFFWQKSYAFYLGDLSNIKFSDDWRFKQVKDKRKESVFLGFGNINFPVLFPIILENGFVLNKLNS